MLEQLNFRENYLILRDKNCPIHMYVLLRGSDYLVYQISLK